VSLGNAPGAGDPIEWVTPSTNSESVFRIVAIVLLALLLVSMLIGVVLFAAVSGHLP